MHLNKNKDLLLNWLEKSKQVNDVEILKIDCKDHKTCKKRVNWSDIELTYLVKGAREYPNKWVDVLEKYKHIFHKARNSSDLRTKYIHLKKHAETFSKYYKQANNILSN